jgi:hypothetical protein
MKKEQGNLFSRLFSRKKHEGQSSEPIETKDGRLKDEVDLFHRLLSTTGAFFRSTNSARIKDKDPWLGSLTRLLACCGYESFKPAEDSHQVRARTHWKAMLFALPSIQGAPKQPPASKGTSMDLESVLRRFRAEFNAKEIQLLSKMPDEPLSIEVEHFGTRFRIVESLFKTLDNRSVCDLRICAADQDHVFEFQDLYYVFEREVELFPGEFISKSAIQGVEYKSFRVENMEFKMDTALLPLLHQKVLRPMSVQKIEGSDTWWYNFIAVC